MFLYEIEFRLALQVFQVRIYEVLHSCELVRDNYSTKYVTLKCSLYIVSVRYGFMAIRPLFSTVVFHHHHDSSKHTRAHILGISDL